MRFPRSQFCGNSAKPLPTETEPTTPKYSRNVSLRIHQHMLLHQVCGPARARAAVRLTCSLGSPEVDLYLNYLVPDPVGT
ncbi:unnamed protein product [Pleuronectes platessa]|uniref:Uncharacterized protein n=1 Tax=Pleuronectes platessa TaxID=8262 RepID=A0A9N7YKT1_PLEPL|nr:unnamed protein product [Pleuronectes platessa]